MNWLKLVGKTIVWEGRLLCLVAIGVPMYFIYSPAAYGIAAASFVIIIVLDTVVSVSVTAVFLRPLLQTMDDAARAGVYRTQSSGYRRMQQTKQSG